MTETMFCPYCEKSVRVGHYRAWAILTSILTGSILVYVLFGLCSSGRVCKECKLRIYPKKVDF